MSEQQPATPDHRSADPLPADPSPTTPDPPPRRRRHRSTLFTRLPADLRRQVDEAIRDRGPGQDTYREVFDKFSLADHKISFTAFQRYARTRAWRSRRVDQEAVIRRVFPKGNTVPSLRLIRGITSTVTSAALDQLLDDERPLSAQQLYYLTLALASQQRVLQASEDRHDRLVRRRDQRDLDEIAEEFPSPLEILLGAAEPPTPDSAPGTPDADSAQLPTPDSALSTPDADSAQLLTPNSALPTPDAPRRVTPKTVQNRPGPLPPPTKPPPGDRP